MIKIAVCGGQGKMARQVVGVLEGYPGVTCSLLVYRAGTSKLGSTSSFEPEVMETTTLTEGSMDVVIDFSLPEGTATYIDECVALKKPLVIGVTGLDEAIKKKIEHAAKNIPILVAPNMSLGVALLKKLTQIATQVLGPTANYEIVETHHRFKKDAPSGTAISLGEAIAKVWNKPLNEVAVFDKRDRLEGEQGPSIGFSSLRLGNVIGEHSVLLGLEDEVIELKHTGMNRQLFAQGAVKAALWLVKQPAGLYTLEDVLAL